MARKAKRPFGREAKGGKVPGAQHPSSTVESNNVKILDYYMYSIHKPEVGRVLLLEFKNSRLFFYIDFSSLFYSYVI